jgi:hypothetical protein
MDHFGQFRARAITGYADLVPAIVMFPVQLWEVWCVRGHTVCLSCLVLGALGTLP